MSSCKPGPSGRCPLKHIPSQHPLKARGLLIAGQAAYFLYEFQEAFELHTRASTQAVNIDDVNDAAWGRCLAVVRTRGRSACTPRLRNSNRWSSVRATDRVRLETARHQLAMFGGDAGIPIGALAWSRLLGEVRSPWVRSGWSYTCATALMVGAQYEEAQTVLQAALAELDDVRFSFARPPWRVGARRSRAAGCGVFIGVIDGCGDFSASLHTPPIFIHRSMFEL